MQPTFCARCKKNIAVVFLSRMEGDKTINEGLCLKCAKSLGLPQVDETMKRMGITDEDLDNLNSEINGKGWGRENAAYADKLTLFGAEVDSIRWDGDTCYVILDSETAANAGIACVSVPWGFRDREFLIQHGASIMIHTPDALTQYILAPNKQGASR